ncbi:hypothetical protein ACI79C_03340 [Geodermatophilus sp. SYSU D00697]
MPPRRRTAAALALALLAAGCTGGAPDPPVPAPTVLATLDLDTAVGTDVRLYDLAPGPDGVPVALVGDADSSWLVRITPGEDGPATATATPIPLVPPQSRLVIAPDGTAVVAGEDLLTVPPTGQPAVTPLDGGPPDAAVLDGSTLFLAGDGLLRAVDVATGAVVRTAEAPATRLAATPDGRLAALLTVDRPAGGTGAALAFYGADLRPDGAPVELVPERPSSPAALQVTAEGTAVATVHLGAARAVGRLVTVADGELRTSTDLDGAGDSALDLAVAPDGRTASVPLADLQYPAELVTVDLDSGERVGQVQICDGTAVLGAVAPAADGRAVTVTGACIDGDGPQVSAFVVG